MNGEDKIKEMKLFLTRKYVKTCRKLWHYFVIILALF